MISQKQSRNGLFVALLSLALPAQAAKVTDLTYDASGSTVTITGCDSSASGNLTIPATIEGKSVTRIGESAFFGCHGLTSVTIGNAVTSIEPFAFFGLRGLENVTIGNAVTTIGTRAFNSCSALEEIKIGSSVNLIEASAFERCSQMESALFPKSVTRIGKSAFRYCTTLTTLDFEGDAPTIGENAFDSINKFATITTLPGANGFDSSVLGLPVHIKVGDLTYNASGTTASVIDCRNTATGPQEVLPTLNGKTVTRIGRNAFERCTGISTVIIPNTITSIDSRAFAGCTGLSNLTIPDSITSLGEGAFEGCISLTSLELGEGITFIPNETFQGSGLTTFSTSGTVTRVGNSAFADCQQLESITFGDRVSTAGSFCFARCSALKEIKFGSRLNRLGFRMFEDCHALESILFEGNAPFIRNNELSDLESDVIVYVRPESRRFRETFGGVPVVVLSDGNSNTAPVVVPPSPPGIGGVSIKTVTFDASGHFTIILNGSNEGIQVGYTRSLQENFQPIPSAILKGDNQIAIPPFAPELQEAHGFFRISKE